MKHTFLLIYLLVILGIGYAQKSQNYYYQKNSTSLQANEIEQLFQKAAKLTQNKSDYIIELKAFTDNTGSPSYNKMISEKRCELVKQLLVKQGFIDSQIFSYAIGMTSKDDDDQLSRRIQIAFLPKNNPFEQLFNFSIKAQKQKFNPQKDFIFVANSGSVLKIPANTLVSQNGNLIKDDEVELSLTEYRNPSDFMVSNIPMNFKDDFFQSGGMFDLQIKDLKGNSLKVKDGNNINMQMSLADTSTSFKFYDFDKNTKTWKENTATKNSETSSNTWKKQTLEETILEMRSESNVIKYDKCPAIVNNPLGLLQKAKNATEKSLSQYHESSMANLLYMNERYKNMDFAQGILKKGNYNKDSLFSISLKDEGNNQISLKGVDNFYELKNFNKVSIQFESLPEKYFTQKWCDIRVKHSYKNDYTFELKGDTSFVNIKVQCFFPKELKSDNFAKNTFNSKHKKLFEDYELDFEERELVFNQQINRKKEEFCDNRVIFELSITDDRDCFWNFMRPYVSKEELKNGKYNWYKFSFDHRKQLNSKFDSLIIIYKKDQQLALSQRIELDKKALINYDLLQKEKENEQLAFASNTISIESVNTYQELQIVQIGLCNVDRLNNYLAIKETAIKPSYVLKNGKKLNIQTVFVTDNKYNTVYKFDYSKKNDENPSNFRISTKNKNKLVALDKRGNIYYLGDKQNWNNIEKEPIFEVEKVKINSVFEMNDLLRF